MPGEFGALPFIWGTLYSSVLALLISTPIALGIAIFLSELSPRLLRTPLTFLTELLAAIPSIVYGLWGIFVLVPLVRQARGAALPPGSGRSRSSRGRRSASACSRRRLILAIMVIPFTSSVAREVLKAVPATQREAAYALGATRWEAIRAALRFGRTGILGRDHARIRPRARRDDGRHDGHRQQPAGQRLAASRPSTRWPR